MSEANVFPPDGFVACQADALATDPIEPQEITSAVGPGMSTGVFGYVDSVDATGVTGWLIDVAEPARKLAVHVCLGASRIGACETGLDRPDVSSIVGKSVACGFHIPWLRKPLAKHLSGLSNLDVVALSVVLSSGGRKIGTDRSFSVAALRTWLEGLPPEAEQFAGRLETLSPYRISGYVLDRTNTTAPVTVEIVLGGQVVAEVLADRERPDLHVHGVRPRCGFQWSVPAEFRDGQFRRFEVRVLNGDHTLEGSGGVLGGSGSVQHADSKRIGRTLALRPGPMWTTGWAVDPASDEPLMVELYVDGQLVGATLAGQYGPDLEGNPEYPFQNVHTRFTFPTPRHAVDGWVHEFRLLVKSWNVQPENARVEWRRGHCFGNLDACEGSSVSGWVAFLEIPTKQELGLPVEVLVDGHLAGQCFLGEQRRDVMDSATCKVAYQFKGDLGHEIEGKVSVRFAGVDLRGSPKHVAPEQKFDGRVDRIDRKTIVGWAADLSRPDGRTELELVIDGQVVASFRPNEPRPDVRKALRLTASNLGFSIRTPDSVLDGETHVVQVRFSLSKEPLRSTVNSVRFPRNAKALPSHDPHPVLSEFIKRGPRTVATVASQAPLVSIIVLNRNGEKILDALLSSFLAVNSVTSYEFVVVDHASKDASISILEKWSRAGVPIKIVALPYNGSFSASNNLAIREHARGEYVLLLNNDIVFVQDVLPELIRTLREDSRVGLAGIKLLDVVEDRGTNFYPTIQHLGIRYRYVDTEGLLPYDQKLSPDCADEAFRPINPAGVTGAVMMCRRSEYLAIGGLDEEYFYGYEDVDICLKYRLINDQEIVCRNDLQVLHHRGYSRLSGREMGVFDRLNRNHAVLMRRWGYAIRGLYRRSLIRGDRVYSSERLRVAFAVTETGPEAAAGDYFTALEMVRALAEQPHVEPLFLSERENWYDLDRIHVLVVMRHDYDLRCVRNAGPDLVKVAWLRNHFETWTQQHWFDAFDVYLSSAPKFVGRLAELGYSAELLPIASNPETMATGIAQTPLRCVVGFNGSAWAVERKVVEVLEEVAPVMPTTIVGRGWDDSRLARAYKGFLPYEQMADFYASTDIVIDDANPSASRWGSANSRVFDALAAGTLVITNSAAASEDLFDGRLPVWSTPQEAASLIRKYTEDPVARGELVGELRALVSARHTYRHRAKSLLDILQRSVAAFRLAIKVPVPKSSERHWWGDWHFAQSLGKALKALGHSVRIDLLPDWDARSKADDVVIVLRGLSEYNPDPSQINLLWILSHPESVSVGECGKYDHVFSSSPRHAAHLQSLGVSASTLLQCADPNRMRLATADPEKRHEHLFVGNSRGQPRKIVSDLLTIGRDLSIFGREWDGLAPEHMVRANLISNEALFEYYGNAGVVYNDHWPDMARWGFLSNRLFDAAACGAYVVSDAVEGLEEQFDGLIKSYEDLDELARLSSPAAISGWSVEHSAALRNIVLSRHTFAHRAEILLTKARELSDCREDGRSVLANLERHAEIDSGRGKRRQVAHLVRKARSLKCST